MAYKARIPGATFRAYVEGTTAGATASQAAVATKQHFATQITGWTDTASLVQLLDGTSVIGEWKAVANESFNIPLDPPVPGTKGNKLDGKIVTSTADCAVMLLGFSYVPSL